MLRVIASLVCVAGWFDFSEAAIGRNKLLLVSLDGFRWDYMTKADTPNIRRLISEGVLGERLKGVFPTLTFPNHYSIVTGRTAEKHGIVANAFFDPLYRRGFRKDYTDEMWWNASEPIWVTAARQNLTAGTYFWPGSEASVNGYRPKYWFSYNGNVSAGDRVDTVVGWLKNDSLDMATLYFDEPDATAHQKGPDAPETAAKIEEIDAVLGYLLDKLNASELEDIVNIILVSDHGMAAVHPSQIIQITRWINLTDLASATPGALGLLLPKPGQEQKVYKALKGAHPNMTVYMKNEIPDRFHYKNNRRITPIVAIADEGWFMTSENNTSSRGAHGYDNALDSMKGIFVARGPDFKVGYKVKNLESLDIYALMCHLLRIKPQPNDGNWDRIRSVLKDGGDTWATSAVPAAPRLDRGGRFACVLAALAGSYAARGPLA